MRQWIVTPDDLKKGDLLDVGWHPAKIIKVEYGEAGKDSKNPGSTTVTWIFKVLEGKGAGVECKRLFSETAWGFAKDFFATMNFPKDDGGNYRLSEELFDSTVGTNLMIYVKRGKSDKGNEFNDVTDFRVMKSA